MKPALSQFVAYLDEDSWAPAAWYDGGGAAGLLMVYDMFCVHLVPSFAFSFFFPLTLVAPKTSRGLAIRLQKICKDLVEIACVLIANLAEGELTRS